MRGSSTKRDPSISWATASPCGDGHCWHLLSRSIVTYSYNRNGLLPFSPRTCASRSSIMADGMSVVPYSSSGDVVL